MPKRPSIFLPLFLIATSIFLSLPCFCAFAELTELQKEARTYRIQGYSLQEQGDLDEALIYYQKAAGLDPGYAAAYSDAGVILEARGDRERARQSYLKAIEVDPYYPNSYSNLALLYEERGDYTNAILCWIKRASLDSYFDHPWAQTARKRLEEIARLHPEAYSGISQEYKQSLQGMASTPSLSGLGYGQTKVSLFSDETAASAEKADAKASALNYLASAKQNFAQGEYVTALKEATVAEYLDPSNPEISAFVEKVRRALLR